jgi:polyisoprenoid-binding protein YceI
VLAGAGNAAAEPRGYTIDPAASRLWVLVPRAGVFSALAHDHIMLAQGFAGVITYDAADPPQSSLQLTVPVASLEADRPSDRERVGLDGDLDEQDRAEIKAIMLSPEVLDAEAYPRVVVTLESLTGTPPDLVLTVRLRIRQAEQVLQVPVAVNATPELLQARGRFPLRQSAFGIEPYRTLLGMIAVEDELQLGFEILARPPENKSP